MIRSPRSPKLAKIREYEDLPRPATEGKVECRQCGYDAPPDHAPDDQCPKCFGFKVWQYIEGQTPIAIPAAVPW